tara:strand:+ start:2840 stop:4822 length:1983 start_codon:yes stop_codon:yes gene_type:complete
MSKPLITSSCDITWTEQDTPVSQHFDDIYFSNHDGLAESRYVFLQHNGLPKAWHDHPRPYFTIIETGFGTGLNFLATWQAFEQAHSDVVQRLYFTSFEKYPLDVSVLKRAHQVWPELSAYSEQLCAQYQPIASGCHRFVLAQGRVILDLWLGDIHEMLPQLPASVQADAWFLDGFSPAKNESMWQESLFEQMAQHAHGQTTFATFTAVGRISRALQTVGFNVYKAQGFGQKREMLYGSTQGHFNSTQTSLPARASQAQEKTASIAVIGAGIATGQILLSLEQREGFADVFCADAEVAQAASGNTQAAVYPLLSADDPILSAWFIQAFSFGLRRIASLQSMQKFAAQFQGVLQLAFDAASQAKLDKIGQCFTAAEFVQQVDAEQAQSVSGVALKQGGLWFPQAGWVCPQEMTQACFKQTQAHHHLYTNTSIECFKRDEQGLWWLWDSQQHCYGPYATLILANGSQVTEFEQTDTLPMRPVRGQVSQAMSLGELSELKTVLCAKGYLTPRYQNQHCFGASYSHHLNTLAFSQLEQDENCTKIEQSFTQSTWAQNMRIVDGADRVSVRMTTRDHLPYIGHVLHAEVLQRAEQDLTVLQETSEIEQGLYMLSGLGSRGFTTAALAAEMLVSQIYGEPVPSSKEHLQKLHPHRIFIRKQSRKQKK